MVKAVVTTGVLGDLVRNVGGEGVQVSVLVPPGTDLHSFQSSPKDSATIREARLIVLNGAGLDHFLEGIIDGAKRRDAVVIEASEGLAPRPLPGGEEHEEGDPHFWQNPLHAIAYVENIRDGLAQTDPARAEQYRRNAEAYIARLRDLDREIEATLKSVPPERRHLVTFHDAFGYFGERYGFKVSAFLPTSGGDFSPARVAEIVSLIRQERIPAIFAEPQFAQDALRQIARDTGVAVGAIISDALTDQTPTYIEMMRANAGSLAGLLGASAK
jgi:ABC-type Zn uptake system ZnuABC Zn-binding protein ZnuA